MIGSACSLIAFVRLGKQLMASFKYKFNRKILPEFTLVSVGLEKTIKAPDSEYEKKRVQCPHHPKIRQ